MRLRIVVAVLMLAGAAYGAWVDEPVAEETVAEVLCDAAVDGSHGLLVVWQEGAAPREICADRIDPRCRRMWSNRAVPGINISNASTLDSHEAAICADGSLGAYIVWTQGAALNREIYAARVGPTGEFYPEWLDAAGPPPVPKRITVSANGCFHPTVCYSGGQVYIAYKNDVYAGSVPAKLPGLEVACYNPAGELQWTADIGPAGVDDGTDPLRVRMWPDSEMGVLVVWERGPVGQEDASTFAIRLDRNGDGIWGQDPVELYRLVGGVTTRARAVCPDGEGGLYVAGPYDIKKDVDDIDLKKNSGELIIVNRLSYSGLWEWGDWDWGVSVTPLVAGQWALVTQSNPAVTALHSGGCVVAWVDDRWPCDEVTVGLAHPVYATSGPSIYAQYIDASGNRKWDEQMEYYKKGDDDEIEVLPGTGRNYFKEGAPLAAGADTATVFGRLYAATSSDDWPCFVWADNRIAVTAAEAGDDDDQLSGWDNITGLALRKNVDGGGRLHATITRENGTGYVELYKDAARTAGDLVAHTASAGAGAQAIIEDNSSGLGGTITVDAVVATDNDISYAYAWPGIYAEEPRLCDGLAQRGPMFNIAVSARDVPDRFVYAADPRWGGYVVWTDDETAPFVDGPDVYAAHINYYADSFWRSSPAVGDGPDVFPPPPVRDFHGTADVAAGHIKLTWSNPSLYCGGEYLGTSNATAGQTFVTDRRDLSSYDLYSVNGSLFGATTALTSAALRGSQMLHVVEARGLVADQWIRVHTEVASVAVAIEYFQVESTDTPPLCAGEYLGQSDGTVGQSLTTARPDLYSYDLYSVNSSLFGATTTLSSSAREGSSELHVADASAFSPDDWVRLDDTVESEYFQVESTDTPFCAGEYLGASDGTVGQNLTTDRPDLAPLNYALYSVNNGLFGATTTLSVDALPRSRELHVADATGLSPDDWIRLNDTVYIEYFQVESTDTTDPGDHVVYLKSRLWTASGFADGSTLTPLTGAPTALTETTDYTVDVATGEVTLEGTVAAGDEVIIAYDTLAAYDDVVYLKSGIWTDSGFAAGSTLTLLTAAPTALAEPGDYGVDTSTGVVTLTGTVAAGDEVIIAYDTLASYDHVVYLKSRVWTSSGFAAGSTLTLLTAAPTARAEPGDYGVDTSTGVVTLTGTVLSGEEVIIAYGTTENPLDDFWGVMIRRGAMAAPLTPEEGVHVFGGPGMPGAGASECFDTRVEIGREYYYTAFSYDTVWADTNFSAGTACLDNPVQYGMGEVRNLTAAPGDGAVTLTWANPPVYDGIRACRPDDTGVLVYEGMGQSCTEGGLVNGDEYTYTVYALQGGVLSYGVKVTAVPLKPVSNFVVEGVDSGNILTWTNPNSVDPQAGTWFGGVRIQCSLTDYPQHPDDGVTVHEGTGESFNHAGLFNGTTYYYTIYVYDKASTKHFSQGVTGSGTAGDKTPPAEVTNLTAIPGNRLVTLEWDNPLDLDFAGVEVERRDIEADETELIFSGVSELLYDQDVENDSEYEYTVRTYDDKDPANVSAGVSRTVTPTVDVSPLFLSGPRVDVDPSGNPVVTWTTNVHVKGRAEYGTTLAMGQTSGWVDSTGTGTPYASTLYLMALRPGATYYIRIRIVDDAGNSSVADAAPYPFTLGFPSGGDTDGDGMLDSWEMDNFGDLSHDGTADGDVDGLTDLKEYQHGTNPDNEDTDGDLKLDGDEVDDQTNPIAPDGPLPMRDMAGGCGSAAALALVLALAAWRRRRG